MRTIRYRWYGPDHLRPMVGNYVASEHARRAYLVLGVKDRGRRMQPGGEHTMLILTVESMSVAAALADPAAEFWPLKWDSRARSASA